MIYCIRVDAQQAKMEVLSTIFVLDANFKIIEGGNPVTFWIDTTVSAEDIIAIEGVEDATLSLLNNV